MNTEIVAVKGTLVELPNERPHQVGLHLVPRTQFAVLLCTVETAGGEQGFGYLFANSVQLMTGVAQMLPAVEAVLVHTDALARQAALAAIRRELRELRETEGLTRMVQALVETALWDVLGRSTGLPINRLIGGDGSGAWTYGSHGLFAGESIDELATSARRLVGEGFTGVKARVGGRPVEEDIRRVLRVREAAGDGVRIMLDALWSMTVPDAVKLCRGLEDADITWIEDPVPELQNQNLRRIRDATSIPVASGERLSRVDDVVRMLDAGAVDIAILDVHHIGGVDAWLFCAGLANEQGIQVASHAAPELHCHLITAIPNGFAVEYVPFREAIYTHPTRPRDSMMVPPQRGGWGLELDEGTVSKYRVDVGA